MSFKNLKSSQNLKEYTESKNNNDDKKSENISHSTQV